ncbi:MAG: hypothetical protein IKW98_05960 [Prevotella sp.]|nr:hypothetical protein [Prevotella sp.]
MTVIHATDPTTQVLSLLYQQREDMRMLITESSNSSDVQQAIRADDVIMMLGHGNEYGLFSKPDKNGEYRRFMITDRHVQFLRDKTCIGIWCYANKFAEKYKLHGLFSGMIISELQEAIDLGVPTTKDDIDKEMEKFTICLKDCIDTCGLEQTPLRMKELDDVQSELTKFNYGNLYYYE